MLGNKYTLEKLLEAEPTLKDKILSFFKGASTDYADVPKLSSAAKKYYKTYKKLFDEFSARNYESNAISTEKSNYFSNDVSGRDYAGIEDFSSPKKIAWRNVDYNDSETKAKITSDLHNKMVQDGLVVKISEETTSKVKESYPDLRGMKKKERLPILKETFKQLKSNLRGFLSGLKNNSFEFEVNGSILEAKIYNVGIDEVLKNVTQEKAEMLYTTKDIFKNAKYLYSTPDYDNDTNVYRWNYFYTPVQFGDNIVGVRIAIRDMAKQGDSQIYHWGIKKDTSWGGVRDDLINRKSNDASSDVSFGNSISQPDQKSNTSTKKVRKILPVSSTLWILTLMMVISAVRRRI